MRKGNQMEDRLIADRRYPMKSERDAGGVERWRPARLDEEPDGYLVYPYRNPPPLTPAQQVIKDHLDGMAARKRRHAMMHVRHATSPILDPATLTEQYKQAGEQAGYEPEPEDGFSVAPLPQFVQCCDCCTIVLKADPQPACVVCCGKKWAAYIQ